MSKKQKRNKQKSFLLSKDRKNKTLFSILIAFFLTGTAVYGADILAEVISKQSETATGDERVTVSNSGVRLTEYINSGNNSTIIGNYFRGYYYDNVYGYFKLDWSSDKTKNVRVVSSTDKCTNGYGYKLGGLAQGYATDGSSEYTPAGFIDFNYNATTFVYYCESDNKLHGKAYSKQLGYHDFEGIGFQIVTEGNTIITKTGSEVFTNDDTNVGETIEIFTGSTSSKTIDEILGERFKFKTTDESIFYIVK